MLKNLITVSGFISNVFGVTLMSGIVIIVKYVTKFMKKIKADNNTMRESVKSLLHNSIYTLSNHYIERGYIYAEEYKNLHVLYTNYIALGGSGVLIDLFDKVKALDWRGGEECE